MERTICDFSNAKGNIKDDDFEDENEVEEWERAIITEIILQVQG